MIVTKRVTKIVIKTYNVTFHPSAWDMVHSEFLELRKKDGMSTKQFETCFCCGKTLPLDKVPTFISVEGVGNRFACEDCMAKEDKS